MKFLDYNGLQYFWGKLKVLFQGKQDTLVSGTNIKTVNGESILGSGNITAGDPNAVKYVAQTLTDAQKTQARTNIGAVAASAISALETAIAAKYSKPSGGIPETDLASGVQSALALARTSIQSLANYYSKTEIDALLDAVGSEQYVDVTTLPTASASTLGKIYLVGPDANGFYDRYYTSYDGSTYSWVGAGNTEINLANYATKEEVSQLRHEVTGDISQLEAKVDGIVSYDDTSATPYETGKYVYSTGQVFGDAQWKISGLISLLKGQKITVNVLSTRANGAVIAVKNEGTGNPFYGTSSGKAVIYSSDVYQYEYTATEDCRVGISFKAADGFVATVKADGLQDQIDKLGDRIDDLNDLRPAIEGQGEVLEGYESVPVVIAQENKGIHYSYGTVVDATGFEYTKPIWLNKNDSISLSLVGGTPNVLYLAIGLQVYENTRFVLSGGVRQASGVFLYEYTATYDTFVCCCFPTASEVSILVKRVPVAKHIERVDSKEPIIVAPFHNIPADGSAGSIFDAETVTAGQLDAEAQRIQKNYPGMLSREVLGKDASGEYDVVQYVCTRRDYFAYKAADALFAWKSSGNAILYTKSFCPVPGDAVYDSAGSSVGLVSAYNSTNSTMTTGGVDYIRSKDDNIAPDVVYLQWDLKEAYIAGNNTWSFNSGEKNVIDRNKFVLGTYANTDFNLDTEVLTFNSKSYHRAKSYDFGREEEHTIVLWGNEHAPQSDPAEPAITLLKMMEDLSSSVAETNPLLRYIKQHCKVIFIPCVNPWGMTTRTGTGRVNYNGVNLNRNYDYKWESVGSVAGESKGNSAGDQPEVRYIMNACAVFGADLAIDIHCLGYGNYINNVDYDCIFPAGGYDKIYFEMRRDYNKYFRAIGNDAESPGEGSGFVCKNLGVGGGLIEMNAGIPNETLHCAGIMQMDYDYLMKMIRLFFQITAPNLYITR